MKHLVNLILLFSCCTVAISNQLTFRGIWVPANDYATKSAADALLDKAKRANLNALFPAVMMHGKAYYKTSHYRYTVAATDDFDPLAYIIKAAHKQNISVHPWFCVYYEGATDTIVPQNPDWLTPGYSGISTGTQYFLDPALPEVKSYLKTVMLDVLNYDIDGFHLDYIRYCGNLYGYGEKARTLFKSEYGFDPLELVLFPEKLAPIQFNQYPIYIIVDDEFNKTHYWIPNRIEPYLAFARIRPKFIRAEQINEIPIPSAILITSFYPLGDKTVTDISRYINRGGNIVYIETGKVDFAQDTAGAMKRIWENDILKKSAQLKIGSFEGAAKNAQKIYTILVDLANQNNRKFDHNSLSKKKEQWDVWRANQIQDLITQLHHEVKKQKPSIIMSAAIGDIVTDKIVVLRDSGSWLKNGLMDIVCPMDYTESVPELKSIIAKSKQDAGEKWNHVYPGLSLYSRVGKETKSRNPDMVAAQIQAVKAAGYTGIMFFSSNQLNEPLVKILQENFEK